MVKDLIVVGTGGWDVIPLIEDINSACKQFNLIGFLEKDELKHGTELFGYPIVGGDDLLLTEFKHCSVINNVMHTTRAHEVVSKTLEEKYGMHDFPNLIHPSINPKFFSIGRGNILYKGAFIGMGAKIGDFNIIERATIGHETIIGNCNLLATCLVGSRCRIGNYNLIGNSATVANNVRMEDDNEIGTGAVLIKKIKSGKHMMGNPAIDLEVFVKNYLSK